MLLSFNSLHLKNRAIDLGRVAFLKSLKLAGSLREAGLVIEIYQFSGVPVCY